MLAQIQVIRIEATRPAAGTDLVGRGAAVAGPEVTRFLMPSRPRLAGSPRTRLRKDSDWQRLAHSRFEHGHRQTMAQQVIQRVAADRDPQFIGLGPVQLHGQARSLPLWKVDFFSLSAARAWRARSKPGVER